MATDHDFKVKKGLQVLGGDVNLGDGFAYKVGGTTVIDGSGNLTNIGSITASNTVYAPSLQVTKDSYQLRLLRADAGGADWRFYSWSGGLNIYPISSSAVYFGRDGATTNVSVYNGALQMGTTTVIDSSRNVFAGRLKATTAVHPGSIGYWKLRDNGGGSQLVAEYSTSDALSDANIKWRVLNDGTTQQEGSLRIGSTTVIDSSRNLTNIGTISSGAITSSGQIQTTASGGFFLNNAVDMSMSYYNNVPSSSFAIFTINNHGDASIGSNLKVDGNHDLVTNLSHTTIRGSATVYTGNGHHLGAGAIAFYAEGNGTATAGTVTAEEDYAAALTSSAFKVKGNITASSGNPLIKAEATTTNWAGLELAAGGNQADYIFFKDDTAERARITVLDNESMSFYQGNAPALSMTLDSNRNLGVGIAPSFRFHAYHPTTNVVARFESGDAEVWIDLHDGNSAGYGALLGHTSTELFKVADSGVNVRMWLNNSGLLDTDAGYSVGGTTVIDSSRNLTNIGKISATGDGTASSPVISITSSNSASFIHASNAFAANMTAGQFHGHFVGKAGSTKNAGGLGYYWAASGSDSNFVSFGHWGADHLLRLYGNGNLNIHSGALQLGGTTVIDSSRNLTNIGTISSGAITSNGAITSSAGLLTNNRQNYASNTDGWLLELGVASNNYAHIHGTIKLQQFNFSTQQIVNFSATVLNTGTVQSKAATSDIDITLKLFVYNNKWYVHVPAPSTFTDISAYVHMGAGYQGTSFGESCLDSLSNAAVPSSGVTGSVDIVAKKRAFEDDNVTFGTISSGAIDVDVGTTSGTFISLTRNGGTEIGRISYSATDNISIHGSIANHAGINFGTNIIVPMSGGAEVDNTVELGDSTRNMKAVHTKSIKVAGTEVLTSGRSLTNIGDISSTGAVDFQVAGGSSNVIVRQTGQAFTSGATSLTGLGIRNTGTSGSYNIFEAQTGAGTAFQVRNNGDVRVLRDLMIGSTTVIDSSRNITANNLTVDGNLTVNGTTTTLNTATLDVEDKNITLNYGAGDTSASADGAGITIQDAVSSGNDATILWDATNDKFEFSHSIEFDATATTTNQSRGIFWTGYDKEGTTDYSDAAYIQHTTNTGGHAGSVLVISSQNDSNDGIAFATNASSKLKHNGNNIATEPWVTGQGYITGNQTITLTGDVTGSGTTSITTTVVDNSHNHSYNTLSFGAANNLGTTSSAGNFWISSFSTGQSDVPGSYVDIINLSKSSTHGIQIASSYGGNSGQVWIRTRSDNVNAPSGVGLQPWNVLWNSGNDGSGSGLDADLLDGQQGSYYAAASSLSSYVAKSGDTMTGSLSVTGNIGADSGHISGKFAVKSTSVHASYDLYNNGTTYLNGAAIIDDALDITGVNAALRVSGNAVWHAGNDGSGSGLDADTIDGIQGSQFLRSDASDNYTSGTLTFNSGTGFDLATGDVYGSMRVIRNNKGGSPLNDGMYIGYLNSNSGPTRIFGGGQGSGGIYITGSGANDIKYNNSSIFWHAGNDGSGSGLDADLLDGQHGSYYLPTNTARANILTNAWAGANGYPGYTYSGGNSRFGFSATSGVVDVYADGNFYATDSSHLVWHAGNDGSGSGLDADTVDGYDLSHMFRVATYSSGYSSTSGQWYNLFSISENTTPVYVTLKNAAHSTSTFVVSTGYNGSNEADITVLSSTWTQNGQYPGVSRVRVVKDSNGTYYVQVQLYWTSTVTSFNLYCKMWGSTPSSTLPSFVSSLSADTSSPTVIREARCDLDCMAFSAVPYVGSAVMWYAGNDGSGSGLDADTVDGIQGSSFVRSDANDTLSAQYTFTKTDDHAIRVGTIRGTAVGSQSGEYIHMYERVHIGGPSGWGASVSAAPTYGLSTYGGANLATATGSVTIGGNTAWHAGNDGSGSGLDADLLDGQHGSYYQNASNLNSGTVNFARLPANLGGVSGSNDATGIYFRASSEVISGEAWCTAHYAYNNNDGFLFVNRDGSSNPHPVFHIGGYNNAGYAGYAGEDSIITLVRTDGTKNAGSTYAGTGLSNSSYYTNIIKTTSGTVFKDAQGAHSFTGTVTTSGAITASGIDQAITAQRDISGNTWSGRVISKNATTNVASFLGNYNGYAGVFAHNGALDAWAPIYINALNGAGQANVYTGALYVNGNNLAWHAGNDGSGSGLDADTVDGIQGSSIWTKSGSWASDLTSNGYTRLQGVNSAGGEFVLLTKNSQITTLIDGDYMAGESGGFFSATDSTYANMTGIKASSADTLQVVQRDGGNANLYVTGSLTVGQDGATPQINLIYDDHASGAVWDTSIHIGRSNDLPASASAPTYTAAGGYGIQFQANSDGAFFGIEEYTTGNYRPIINWGDDATDTPFRILFNGSGQFVFSYNGNFTAAGNVTAYSDIRLKENIEVIPNALEKVQQIRGVTFTRNDQKDTEKRHAGVIAQEVEKVLPEVVEYNEEEDVKTVSYGNMVGLLIEAIKEQQTQIEELKAQVQSLMEK